MTKGIAVWKVAINEHFHYLNITPAKGRRRVGMKQDDFSQNNSDFLESLNFVPTRTGD